MRQIAARLRTCCVRSFCSWWIAGALIVVGCNGNQGAEPVGEPAQAPNVAEATSAVTPPPPVAPDSTTIASCKNDRDEAACAKACDADDMPSCSTLGALFLKKTTPTAKAACDTPLRKACDAKIGRACSLLANCLLMVELGGGAIASKEEKTALNIKACDLDDGSGCFSAGKAIEEGYGAPADSTKGAALMAKAFKLLPQECNAGVGDSCLQLAMQYDPETMSKRVPKDRAKALALYEHACRAGVETGCGRGGAK